MTKFGFYQRFASWLLKVTERFYLKAHGWDTASKDDHFLPPGDYPFRVKVDEYQRRHAVNAQHAVYGAVTRSKISPSWEPEGSTAYLDTRVD